MQAITSSSARNARRILLAAVAVAGLTIGSGRVGCEDEVGIDLYPVELVDPAPDEPFAIDPLLAPRPLDCDGCVARTVVLAGGDQVLVRADAEPAVRLRAGDVAFVELGEPVSGDDAGRDAIGAEEQATGPSFAEAAPRFAVFAVLTPSGRARWTAFAESNANRFVLVEIEGRAVDLFRPLGWSRGLRIGVFDDAERRDRFVSTLRFERRGREASFRSIEPVGPVGPDGRLGPDESVGRVGSVAFARPATRP
ncbi:MAG: hypothetical protein R3F35_09560 [Myxococcota bacterium]